MAILIVTRPDSWQAPMDPASPSPPTIEVSLQDVPAAAPPAPPAPPTPPTPPTAHKVPLHPLLPRAVPVTATPVAELQPKAVEPEAVLEGGAVIASSDAAMSAAATRDSRADLEAQYAAVLRADIDRRTHPPDSVQYRLRRPSGEVRVGFVVTRSGETKEVRVMRSSGSAILDQAALSIVSSGHYPPMQAQIFAGETEHVFSVTIEFRRPNT